MKILTTNQSQKTITSICAIAKLSVGIACCAMLSKPALAKKDEVKDLSNQPIPEIGWGSRLSSMGLDEDDNVGKKYNFDCQAAPEDLIHAPIWGTKVYTVNSGICSTAVHSGMIDPETGGKITVKLLEGKDFYTGSQNNDVISKDHRNTDLSFTFVGEKVVEQRQVSESTEKRRKPSRIEEMLMDGFQRGVEKSIENTINDILN